MASSAPARYSLLLDEQSLGAVERLQSTYALKNKADVFDLAIRLLTWATEQQVSGHEFGRFADGRFEPLVMPVDPVGAAVKYRHPVSGETWDGRGEHPKWLRDALLKQGYTADELQRGASLSSSSSSK